MNQKTIISLPTTKTGKTVDCKTNRILSEVTEYLNLDRPTKLVPDAERQDFLDFYIRSLGEHIDRIDGYKGYCEGTLFYQRDYVLKRRNLNKCQRRNQMMMLVDFYRFIVYKYPDEAYFSNAIRMPLRLLNNHKLTSYFLEGWDFISYSSTMKYDGQGKVVFVLHGFDLVSTRMAAEDFIPVEFDRINNIFLRELLFDYMRSSVTSFMECIVVHVGSIAKIVNSMSAVKNGQFTGSASETHWTVQEARLMRRLIDASKNNLKGRNPGQNTSIGTKNNRIGFLRRWFMWANSHDRMTFERTFFDELSQFEEPTKRDAKPIPAEYLQPIFDLAKEKSEVDDKTKLCYITMKLIHQTNFRPSDILSLRTTDITQALSAGVNVIQRKTKTSGRSKQLDTLTKYDTVLIDEAIAVTAPLRENAVDATMKNRIFIYQTRSDALDVLKCSDVYKFMHDLSRELGLAKAYGPYNLRYTYMTKVFEKAVANDMSEAEVRVLTKHVKLGTTLGYVKKNRTDYFKALCQVMMEGEQMDVSPKVVDKIPEGAQELGVREGGCGKCKAANCLYKSILPCVTCENFVTTIEYEPFFKHMIHDIDEQLESAVFPHDREDLVTIKEVYVSFLIEIDKRKHQIQ